MSEAEAAVVPSYRDLIKEAYIDPIRTVLVIDDEFPTLDGMVHVLQNKKPEDALNIHRKFYDNAGKVKELLDFCRSDERKWMVDIHDGKQEDDKTADYLHQSDLLILDYQLDGDHSDGEKAVKIIQKLAESDHFNMVVVYTQHNIQDAFNRIVFGLLSEWELINSNDDHAISDLLENWEEEAPGIYKQLTELINEDTYLKFRLKNDSNPFKSQNEPEVKIFFDLCKEKESIDNERKKDLFKYLLNKKQTNIIKQFNDSLTTENPVWKSGQGYNWIETNRIFITVIPKTTSLKELLLNQLIDSLENWFPTPHRLIAAKMVNEIESKGMNKNYSNINNNMIQASWFYDLLESNEFNSASPGLARTEPISNMWHIRRYCYKEMSLIISGVK